MQQETIEYICGDTLLKGFLAYDPTLNIKRPAVIVAHAWKGQDDFARNKAIALAEIGYVGFAADVYGNGISVHTDDEAQALMLPLFLNRQLLRDRINAAFDLVKEFPIVDPSQIGAIGFCFGGLTVIELLRSGADVRGVVSFHGVLGNTVANQRATCPPNAEKMDSSILILHGNDDPLVTPEDIRSLQKELTEAGVDWQMNIYGHAVHAFTNPELQDVKTGLAFDIKANYRSWIAMSTFFDEIFIEGF